MASKIYEGHCPDTNARSYSGNCHDGTKSSLMPDYYRRVTRLLRTNQYERVQVGKGSHGIWENVSL